MQPPVIVVGVGQMGGVFARGFLRTGYPVVPVLRSTDPADVAERFPDPALALVAVAEGDLHPTLATLPDPWRDRAALLQNELLPRDWEQHGIDGPTVVVAWFEKKAGRAITVIQPSPVWGPRAGMVVAALDEMAIPTVVVADPADLLRELVAKNLYILVANIGGLVSGGTVGHLFTEHRETADAVTDDVLAIQAALTQEDLPADRLRDHLAASFAADPDHGATGRSAPARLRRAIALADQHGLDVPALRQIAARHL